MDFEARRLADVRASWVGTVPMEAGARCWAAAATADAVAKASARKSFDAKSAKEVPRFSTAEWGATHCIGLIVAGSWR